MQYRLPLPGQSFRFADIEDALVRADPSAIADVDLVDGMLRVSTLLDDEAVLQAISRAGVVVARAQLERLPSECCGGCGG